MTVSPSPNTQQRARGAVVGAILGDAFGRPYEGAPVSDGPRIAADLRQRFAHPRALGHSDDGEMTLALYASLQAHPALDPEHFVLLMADTHDPARGYGKGTRAVFRAVRGGATWQAASRAFWQEGSRGNGAAARVSPVAALHANASEEVVATLARTSALVTHAHPEAVDGAVLIAVATHAALHATHSGAVLEAALRWAGLHGPRIQAVERLRNATHSDVASRLGNGVHAIDSVPAAVWAFTVGNCFEEVVANALQLGGDTDTIGAMAGGIAGGYFGLGAIPVRWVNALEPEVRHALALNG